MTPDEARRYAVSFEGSPPHRHLVGLLAARPQRGLVVDLGCGHAPQAERLAELGFDYAGVDTNEVALAEVRAGGHRALAFDLGDLDGLPDALDLLVGDRDVVAVTALDVIEHLVDPGGLLARLHSWMTAREVGHLGLSVPNVSHQDVAVKLVAGRWDLTPRGLLDATHVRFFTDASLTALVASSGFDEVGRDDVVTERSGERDQHWPAHHPAVVASTPLGAFLRRVRRLADPHGLTYQFVRLYRPVPGAAPAPTLVVDRDDRAPLLSIVVAPDAGRPIPVLADALAGQAGPRLEVICVASLADELRRRIGVDSSMTVSDPELDPGAPAEEGIRRLLAAARGEYAIVVHGELVPAPGLAAAVVAAVQDAPGSVVCVDADRPGPDVAFAFPTAMLGGLPARGASTELVAALSEMLSPLCGVTSVGSQAASATDAGGGAPETLTLGPPELVAERDALRRRVAELEQWSASIAADNEVLNAALNRPAIRLVRLVGRLGRRVFSRRARASH